jgi:hypothetical protein
MTRRRQEALLWTIQALLAMLFLFAGGMKLALPLDKLAGPVPLPGLFLRFIGMSEVLGAIGLILPGVLQIRPQLTSLAASGLVVIMAGATAITVATGTVALGAIPLFVGILAAVVAHGRSIDHRFSNAPTDSVTASPAL